MKNKNWTPSARQEELVARYKQREANQKDFDGKPNPNYDEHVKKGLPMNDANIVAQKYMQHDIEGAKAAYRQANMDKYLDEALGDDVQGTMTTNSGRVVPSGSRLWTASGELNVGGYKNSNSEALQMLERHAKNTIWNEKRSMVNMRIADQEKQQLMEKVQDELRLGNTQTLGRVVAQLQRPVRRVLDYIGFARKSAIVHEVAQGEVPYYDIDPQVVAYVVANDAAVPANRIESERVFPQRERIMANVQISIEEAAIRSFNQMERSKDLAIQDMQRKEDQKLLNAWWIAAHDTNTPVGLPNTLTLGSIEAVALAVDQNDLHTTRIYMNRSELRDIRANMISQFDPVTQREVFNTGMLGTLYDYMLYVSPVIVPKGFIFATTEPDYLSAIAIWFNTTVEIANRFAAQEPVYGFTFFEVLGFTVVNDAAVAVGMKPGAVVPSYFSAP